MTSSLLIAAAILAVSSDPKVKEAVVRPHLVLTFPEPAKAKARIDAIGVRLKVTPKDDGVRALLDLPPEVLKDGEPAYLWFTAQNQPPVLEITVAKAEAADKALLRAQKAMKNARVVPTKGKRDGIAVAKGDLKNPLLLALREKDRLFVVFGTHREPVADLFDPPAVRSAKLGSKPTRAPLIAKDAPSPPDVWIHGDAEEGIDKATGAVWLEADRVRALGTALLDFKAGLLVGELAGGDRSRTLLPPFDPTPVAEVTAKVSPTTLSSALGALEIPASTAQLFSGDVSAVLTEKGCAVAALGIRPGAVDQIRAALDRLSQKKPGTSLSVRQFGEGKVLVAVTGGEDQKAVLERIAGDAKASGLEHTPFWVKIDPSRLSDALARFSKTAQEPGPARRMAERAEENADWVQRMKSAEMSVTFPPGEITAEVLLVF